MALPGELKGIASAVARARDRQVAEWLRLQAVSEKAFALTTANDRRVLLCVADSLHNGEVPLGWLADRIEAGAVDRE